MEACVYDYLALKVMEDLRSEQPLDDNLANALYKYKIIDHLRLKVKSDDFELLCNYIRTGSAAMRGLAIGMLKYLLEDEKNRELLFDLWQHFEDFQTKMNIMFRLLDIPELENSKHEMLYAFVKQNWQRFMQTARDFPAQGESVIEVQQRRIADPAFPETKKWIYLCLSLASDDTKKVIELLNQYTESNASIVAKVAVDLKHMIKNTTPLESE